MRPNRLEKTNDDNLQQFTQMPKHRSSGHGTIIVCRSDTVLLESANFSIF